MADVEVRTERRNRPGTKSTVSTQYSIEMYPVIFELMTYITHQVKQKH